MAYDGYQCLRVEARDGVAWVTIDHPPINLFDMALIGDMLRVGEELEKDDAVRVVVFQGADPDFFIAHADVELIQTLPAKAPPKPTKLGFFHEMVDRMRTMPKATIAKIEGIARGGGSEFVLSCDMRFGALGKCVLAQPEVALGIIPGGGGTQRPRTLGERFVAPLPDHTGSTLSASVAEQEAYLGQAVLVRERDHTALLLGRDSGGGHQHSRRRQLAQCPPARPGPRCRSVHEQRRVGVPESGCVRNPEAWNLREPRARRAARTELRAVRHGACEALPLRRRP
jgi:enoyl-CoA hydratase/carnithine racemase